MRLNNDVRLRGNVVAEPEVVEITTTGATPEKIKKITLRLAVNNGKTKAGTDRPTTFVDVQAFRRNAEVLAQYIHKGDELYVGGELMLDTWTAADGTNRSKLYVVLSDFNFGRKRGDAAASASAKPAVETPVWTEADTQEILTGDPEDSLYDDVASSLV